MALLLMCSSTMPGWVLFSQIGDVARGAGGVLLVRIGGVVGDLIVAPAALPLAVAIGQRRALRRKAGQPA
jgi:hypothetical protein